ncbi:hypothetical protein G7070_00360 [Propioniciclava coleopterorum]|uniref:Uncharacterized protein n=1 Tax=Propioniciclava coleopterorum TaxID=2714937 RepID=A0A6G7Y2L3_9ACTN|nr:hypothetical protein [Propioniciclava coleopterorum]QIK71013.1 hypothetical protein G7070_00360 [Propioniciclava coleopterorum]
MNRFTRRIATAATAAALVFSSTIALASPAQADAYKAGSWVEVKGATSANCHPLVQKTIQKSLGTVTYSTPTKVGLQKLTASTVQATYRTQSYIQFGVRKASVTLFCDNMKGKAYYTYKPTLYSYRTKMDSQYCYALSCQFFPGRWSSWS